MVDRKVFEDRKGHRAYKDLLAQPGPRGETGATGNRGEIGPQGDRGEKGDTGPGLAVITAPTTSHGSVGDTAGMVAFDNNYIYYCVRNYTSEDGIAIWKRTALSDW